MNKNQQFEVQDERKLPFTMIDNRIMDSMSFSGKIDKLLYLCISRFSHHKEIFPSYGTLCKMVGVTSVNTLKAALERLEEMKLIKVQYDRKKENGENLPNLYRLLEPPAEVLENSVFDKEKLQAKKEEIKKQQAEKAKRRKGNTPLSKNDGGASKNDGGLSKNDGGASKNEHYNKELINKNLKTRTYNTISQSIERLDVSEMTKHHISKNPDRLTDDILKVIEEQYTLNNLPETVFNKTLVKCLKGFKEDFEPYFIKSLQNAANEQETPKQPNEQTATPKRVEKLPDWFHEEEQSKEAASDHGIEDPDAKREELAEKIKRRRAKRAHDKPIDERE